MSTKQVTLIGGPADLQRHVIPRHLDRYQVAELPDLRYCDPNMEARHVECSVHVYRIREVGYGVFVGIHEVLRR